MREQLSTLRKIKYIKLLVYAQFADLAITLLSLTYLDCWEMNPLMRRLSLLDMSLAKLAITAFIVFTQFLLIDRMPLWSYKLFFWASAFPVFWNVLVISAELLY